MRANCRCAVATVDRPEGHRSRDIPREYSPAVPAVRSFGSRHRRATPRKHGGVCQALVFGVCGPKTHPAPAHGRKHRGWIIGGTRMGRAWTTPSVGGCFIFQKGGELSSSDLVDTYAGLGAVVLPRDARCTA